MDVKALTNVNSAFKQMVTFPTRGNNTLDIFVTNMKKNFKMSPLPPLTPDDPSLGMPSDHVGVLAHPVTLPGQGEVKHIMQKREIEIRKFPQSKLDSFGLVLGTEKWEFLAPNLETSCLVKLYEYYVESQMNVFFPKQKIYIHK